MRSVARAIAIIAAAACAPVPRTPDERPAQAEEAPRKHKADPRALELVRKADRTTYRPTDAGLKSLRCKAEYVMTNGCRYRMAYAMEAPGKSTIAFRAAETGDPDPWSQQEEFRKRLDELFDGPRIEKWLEPYELEFRLDDGKPSVVALRPAGEKTDHARIDLRFLPDGPLAEEGPPLSEDPKRTDYRRALSYEREGDLFARKKETVHDPEFGDGRIAYQYARIGGILLPKSHGSYAAGFGGTLTITDVEVNVAVTAPAALPSPTGPPTQAELDALDVAGLVAKVREPFVGKEPNAVTMLRIVRAFAKKGDDAKRAIPILVAILGYDRGDKPETDAPADFEEFHEPLERLLADLRPESIRPLIAALRSPSTDQRYWAAGALGEMGKDGAPAIDALVEALGDETWQVSIYASASLRKIGCPAERALPALVKKSDARFMGEDYADEAIEFAKSDPDGDKKLVDALLAAPLKITREPDGRIRGIEHILRKRGQRLIPLLLEATEIEAVDAALVAIGAAARPGVEALIASRPADGEDAARERAKKLLERLPAK